MDTFEKYHLKENPFDIYSHEHKMANRKDEWKTITTLLETAFAGKGPKYFVILGDYGVGKTYMLEHIFRWISKESPKANVFPVYSKTDVLYEKRLALMESEPKWSKFGLDFIVRIFDNIEPEKFSLVMKNAKLGQMKSKFNGVFEAIKNNNPYAFAYLRGEKIPQKESQALGFPGTSITDSPTGIALFFDFLVAIYSAGYSSFLLLVDEFEHISTQGERKITQILNTFRKIFDDFGDFDSKCKGQIAKPLFMFATSPGGWDRLKDLEVASVKKTGGAGIAPFMERVSPRDVIKLQPFSFENAIELIENRLSEARSDTNVSTLLFPFTKDAIKYVTGVSFNKPRNIIQYCGILLEDAQEKKLDTIDVQDAAEILQKYGIFPASSEKPKKSSSDSPKMI